MSTITQALRTAQSGLLTHQNALNTVSNNISNVSTPGYSKKTVNIESHVVNGIGVGVKISSVTRRVDEGLLKLIRQENSELANFSKKEDAYNRLQELFGRPADDSSLSHIIESFSEASELLATTPDKFLEQSEFVRRAEELAYKFNDMSNAIQEQRLQADKKITDVVSQMNTITSKIDKLNDDIISASTISKDVTDFQDQRDTELDKLSKLIDIKYFSRNDGDVVVFASGGKTLIDTVPPVISHKSASSMAVTSTRASGEISGIFVGTAIKGNDITDEVKKGEIKALIDLRDDILPNLQSQLDELATEIKEAINTVHNRGVFFPGAQSMTGTRSFIKPGTQTVKLDATGGVDDVKIIIFDTTGKEASSTTLNTIMDSASYGADKTSRGSWTITEVASALQEWLQETVISSATATINTVGKFEIKLNSTNHHIAFRDETASSIGSTAADAEIGFDSNGDGNIDETISGFSNFLGLNDFYVNSLSDNMHNSNVIDSGFTTTAATLTFHDTTTLGTSNPLGGASLTVNAGTTLTDLATSITANVTNVTASVIPDGAGVKLRISHDKGSNLVITQASSNTLLSDIAMHKSEAQASTTISVRSDIAKAPAKISTGMAQFNSDINTSGEYFMSIGDDTTIQQLAKIFSDTNSFDKAGGLPTISQTFAQYSSEILSHNAVLAASNERQAESQRTLNESLQYKSDSLRGVNLDEEMSDLIILEQSYAAAARLISVISKMFETLEQAVM